MDKLFSIILLFLILAGSAFAQSEKNVLRHGIPYNAEWIEEMVSVGVVETVIRQNDIPPRALYIKTNGGRVAIIGSVETEEQKMALKEAIIAIPYVIEYIDYVLVHSNLYVQSVDGIVRRQMDNVIARAANASLDEVFRNEAKGFFQKIHLSVSDNVLTLVGWADTEDTKEAALKAVSSGTALFGNIELGKNVHSIVDLVTVHSDILPEITSSGLDQLVQKKIAGSTNTTANVDLLLHVGSKLLDNEKYEQAESLFAQAMSIQSSRFSPYYGMALIDAQANRYYDALQNLKLAARCDDFQLTFNEITMDFSAYPVLVMAIPDNPRMLATKTIQLFELLYQLGEIEQRFREIYSFEANPSQSIKEARRVLGSGGFDATYVNYMRSLSEKPRITDDDLNEVIESLSFWRFAYVARACQIALALYGGSNEATIDSRLKRTLPDEYLQALETNARDEPAMVVSLYRERFSDLIRGPHQTTTESAMLGSTYIHRLTSAYLRGGIPLSIVTVKQIEKGDLHRKEEIFNFISNLPRFNILDWKEATLDYWDQKKKFRESIKIIENIIAYEKGGGDLSSDSLTRLYKARSSMIQYELYADKLYRSFLFDAPLNLTLVGLDARIDHATSWTSFRADKSSILLTGQEFAKLTPVIEYVVLDYTHAYWLTVLRKIKKSLNEKEYKELETIARTQPNWMRDPNTPDTIH